VASLRGILAEPSKTGHKEAASITFDPLPNLAHFKRWKILTCRRIAEASIHPATTMQWLAKIDLAQDVEDLADDEGFDTLDFKVATGLSAICAGTLPNGVITNGVISKFGSGAQAMEFRLGALLF